MKIECLINFSEKVCVCVCVCQCHCSLPHHDSRKGRQKWNRNAFISMELIESRLNHESLALLFFVRVIRISQIWDKEMSTLQLILTGDQERPRESWIFCDERNLQTGSGKIYINANEKYIFSQSQSLHFTPLSSFTTQSYNTLVCSSGRVWPKDPML